MRCTECSLSILFPSMSIPVQYMQVDTVDGVGVNICTCSGFILSFEWQNLDSSCMSSSRQPGWAAMK